MRVRATKLGYYDIKRKQIGDVFVIKGEKEFSKSWMEKTEDEPVRPSQRPKKPVKDSSQVAETEVI